MRRNWQRLWAAGPWPSSPVTAHSSSLWHPSDLRLALVRWDSILRSLHREETEQPIQYDYALNKLISMVIMT